MRYRVAVILLAAGLPLSAFAQQAGLSGDASQDKAGVTGASDTAKTHHHRRVKSAQARAGEKVTPDATAGATTGAAAGVAKAPQKVDPEVHNLNTTLPP